MVGVPARRQDALVFAAVHRRCLLPQVLLLQQGLQRVQQLAAGLSQAEQRLQQQVAQVAAAAAAVQREQCCQQQIAGDTLGSLTFNVGGKYFQVCRGVREMAGVAVLCG